MGKRVCMFCGATKLTSAHLISRSLQKLLPRFDGTSDHQEVWLDPTRLEWRMGFRTINVSPANHQVKRLCHGCNGQWMAGIEAETRDTLAALAEGQQLTLDADQQLYLATWATIVSMLRATQDSGLQMVTDEEMAHVRRTSAPPPGFHVWLIRGEHRTDITMRHFRVVLPEGPGWFGWIWIGQAVLAVSSANLAPHTHERLAWFPAANLQIYPTYMPASWPVESWFSHYTLYDLMNHQ